MLRMSPITHMCQEVLCRGYHRTHRLDRRFLTLVWHVLACIGMGHGGTGQRKAPKTDMMVHARRGCPWADPGCSSCSHPIPILHRAPLVMGAPCGRFRAAVRWLQVGTQVGTTGANLQGLHWSEPSLGSGPDPGRHPDPWLIHLQAWIKAWI